jgi:hypothetical protein
MALQGLPVAVAKTLDLLGEVLEVDLDRRLTRLSARRRNFAA